MKKVKIVLFGVSLQSANKGCEALAWSMFSMLNIALRRRGMFAEVCSVVYLPKGETLERDLTAFERIDHSFLVNRKKSLAAQRAIVRAIMDADFCIDMTEGDSFSDFYGKSRFYWRTAEKAFVLLCGKRLILGPQTYGPFDSENARRLAGWVLKRAYCVCARDASSALLAEKLSGRRVYPLTDIAFGLPAEPVRLSDPQGKRIGINVSALLWNGGYTGKNQFGLKADYRQYIIWLIRWCLEEKMEVWLIPHVIMAPECEDPENDLAVCLSLGRQFPACRVANFLNTPMSIKGLIGQMDVFVGARMHAVIGALSCGVPSIPFAYSKKFGDLLGSIGYPALIDSRILSTEEALRRTCKLISESASLSDAIKQQEAVIGERLGRFSQILDSCLSDGVLP